MEFSVLLGDLGQRDAQLDLGLEVSPGASKALPAGKRMSVAVPQTFLLAAIERHPMDPLFKFARLHLTPLFLYLDYP